MTTAPPPPPDLESARLLIAELRKVTDRFAADLDARPNDTIELSAIWFDFTEELTEIGRRARQLRNEAFAASVRAAVPNLLPATALQVAREFSAAVVDKHRESS